MYITEAFVEILNILNYTSQAYLIANIINLSLNMCSMIFKINMQIFIFSRNWFVYERTRECWICR